MRLFAAVMFVLASAAAWAEVPPGTVAALRKSHAQFEALLQRSGTAASPPLLSDPAAAPVLERLWDHSAILGSGPFKAADFGILRDILEIESKVSDLYRTPRDAGGLDPNARQVAALHQNERSRALAMKIRCWSAFGEALEDVLANSPGLEARSVTQNKTIPTVRFGALGTYIELDAFLRQDDLAEENELPVARAIGESLAGFALMFPKWERAAFKKQIEEIMPKMHDAAKVELQQFLFALETTECGKLCRNEVR